MLVRTRRLNADRSRDCIKAHQSAIEITKAIAAALREANETKAKEGLAKNSSSANASPPPTTPGQRTAAPSDQQKNEQRSESTPSATTPAGAGGGTQAASSDGSAPVVVVGQKKGGEGEENGVKGARPVLTLMQHLCVSAPERAEGRVRVAEGLSALLPEVEESDRARFVAFLAKVRF